jgi:anti-anti-sigma factor
MSAWLGDGRTRRRGCGERIGGDARARPLELRAKIHAPHVRVLTVTGSLTVDRADCFCSAVRDQLAVVPRVLVLEMTGVATVDTAGVRALVHVARLADEAAVRLVLVSGSSTAVGVTLQVNGLVELFEIRQGIDQAISETN